MLDQGPPPRRRRIAVVGGGISGLSAAYYLSAHHDVTLYEASCRSGGHARTVLAGRNGDQPVDTGFIVFNYATYPHLTQLFNNLNVPVVKSDMSFCVSIDDGAVEYGLNSLAALLAQKGNLLRPRFYKMVADIIRFGRQAVDAAGSDDTTIAELVTELGLGRWFRNYYLLPMCGAIWSTPFGEIGAFPAKSLVRFFRNHALLAGAKPHQWWTVKGGSIEYVRRLETAQRARGCRIHTGTPVRGVCRRDQGVTVKVAGQDRCFDDLVLTCHADQALGVLGNDASRTERRALSAIRYQSNVAVLHCDPGQMPKRRACWSSWACQSREGAISVTYWMNRLQGIVPDDPLFVTLNPARSIRSDRIYDTVEFTHPVFDRAAIAAQKTIRSIQGQNRTWFAGAWNRHGFHEDGIASAMRIARAINAPAQGKGPEFEIHGQCPQSGIPVHLRTSGQRAPDPAHSRGSTV